MTAYFGYLLAFVVATAACLGAAWRARSVVPYPETRQALTWLFSGSAAWALAYVGFLLVGPALWKHLFYQASLIVGFSVVFAWLWFCSAYSGRGLHRSRKVQQFAAAVFVIVTALKVTNPLHGLYYGLEPAGGGPTGGAFGLVVTHETLYWVVMSVAYALSAAGYLMLLEVFLKAGARTGPLALLTGLTALPAALNVVGHVDPTFLDITHEPLGVAVFAVGLMLAYETRFSVVQLTGSVEEPNLTIGSDGRIRGLGGGIEETVPPLSEEDLGRPLREALPGLAEALQAGEAVWEARFGERSGNRREDGCRQQTHGQRRAEGQRQAEGHPRGGMARHYRIMTSALRSGEDPKTVVLSDITDRRRRRKELERRDDLFRKAQSLADVGAWEYDVRGADVRGADAQGADLQDGCLSWSEEVYRIHGLSGAGAGGAGRFEGAGLSAGTLSSEDARSSGDGEKPEDAGPLQDGEDPKDVGPFEDGEVEDGEELSVGRALRLYHREDRQRIEGALRRAISQGVPFSEEARIRRPDGQVRWVRIYGEPQGEEPQGETLQAEDPARVGGGKAAARVRGAVQDITGRKRREKTLQRLREKYQGLLEGAPDAIFVASAESGQVVEANQAAASLLGAPAEEIAGRHQSELHPSGEAEKYRSLFETATEEAEAEGMSFTQLEDGSQIYVETDSGKKVPVEISATTVDLSGEEPSGREPNGGGPNGGGPNAGGQEITKKKTGKVFVGIFRDITERKRRTERLKEAKKQAELSKLEAEEASRMKSAMLANMSHEIRTPLTGVIGFAEAIGEEMAGEDTEKEDTGGEDAEGEGKVARFAGLIEDSGRRLLDTLDAVLNLSKLEAGKMSLKPGPVDLAGQARQVAREFEEEAAESGLTLGVETEEAWARADEGGLKIVLQNLLSNAIKYTEEGGVTVRVYREENSQGENSQGENTREMSSQKASSQEASSQSAGQKAAEEAEAPTDSAAAAAAAPAAAAAVLEVEDSGIGMDPEVAGRLFEPFRQASEGMSREYEGTGIGLAVTKRAAEEMGGSIEVDTQKGEGSRFTVRFPAAEPSAGEPQQANQRDPDKPTGP
ncbi:ATP-binding protein [Salinibacter ruber]|uniref:sensor histidine kinase n=2 Tax=Salinibacter ruber TaxID=146919 RepID=UPI002168921F|nr:ATP-binding protein [Salinibacter ruber]MCS4051400.1 PAS domain S-box-containing protein [Salinibacter ruber]